MRFYRQILLCKRTFWWHCCNTEEFHYDFHSVFHERFGGTAVTQSNFIAFLTQFFTVHIYFAYKSPVHSSGWLKVGTAFF